MFRISSVFELKKNIQHIFQPYENQIILVHIILAVVYVIGDIIRFVFDLL